MDNKLYYIVKAVVYCVIFGLTWLLFYDLGTMVSGYGMRSEDFLCHIAWSYQAGFRFILSDENNLSYPLFHVLVYYLARFTALSFPASAAVVCSASVVFSVIILDYYMKKYLNGICLGNLSIFGLSTGLIMFMPLYIPTLTQIYLGQFSGQPWHSPTYLIVKPFAILCFFLFIDIYQTGKEEKTVICRWRFSKQNASIVFLSALLILSMIAKPSFIFVFGPSIVVFLIIELIRSRFNNYLFVLKIIIALIPSLFFALFQYGITLEGQGTGLMLAPFAIWAFFSSNILLSFILCFAFPIFVCCLLFKSVISDKFLLLSVVTGVAGILEFILLAESGYRFTDGNIAWSMMCASLIMFIGCAISFIRYVRKNELKGIQWIVPFGYTLLFLHIGTGVFYFCTQLAGWPLSF